MVQEDLAEPKTGEITITEVSLPPPLHRRPGGREGPGPGEVDLGRGQVRPAGLQDGIQVKPEFQAEFLVVITGVI